MKQSTYNRQNMWYLELRQKFFTMRIVGHWNGVNGEAGAAPSLECSKPAWSNVGLWEVSQLELDEL